LYCSYNNITYLQELPNSLIFLVCDNNKLTHLQELPNSLTQLNCGNNQLTTLQKLPNNLKYLNCNNTIIDEIIDVVKNSSLHKNEFNKINKKLYILNKFRELYFALKFKKQFYKLYETVVMKRYHPSNLIKLLENVGDDEEQIDLLLKSW
jgi:Leucine-rich repeat (LRR) protein